jgi:ferredoxin
MIFYFSATGNCRYVAERAAAATGERCVSITACMQAGELAFTPRDGEMVGIVSPVYFWGLPSIVNAFLERLILGRPEYLWFAATYGTTTGQAGRFVSEHLRAKVPLPAVRVYYPHYERVRRTGYFAVTDACVGCGLCARNCPVSAIEIRDGRPVWVKEQCVMCLACLHRCPKFAIRRGKKTAGHGQYVHPEFAGK